MFLPSDKVPRLIEWCTSNKVEVDSRLAIVEDSTSGDITVRNASEDFIIDSKPLVTIPKSAILSIRTCSLSQTLINAIESRGIGTPPYGHEAKLTLAVGLYNELCLGPTSRWAGYLQSLPQQPVPIALFWGYQYEDGLGPDVDGLEARALITGTEVEREFINRETGRDLLTEIREFYETLAYPLLSCEPTGRLSLRSFHYAYSLVSSRAFLVDGCHGLSMVPVADAFNHDQDNNVHLESDFDVCTRCGSTNECEHDSLEAEVSRSRPSRQREMLVCVDYGSEEEDEKEKVADYYGQGDSTDTCEMAVRRVIPPRSEVFNTYGEKLSNAELLAQYGFMLEEEGNENDVVKFEYEEVAANLGGSEAVAVVVEKRVIEECIGRWGYERGWEEGTGRVYNVGGDGRRTVEMRINAEGRISHDLWMVCALCGMRTTGGGTEGLIPQLKTMASRQIEIEENCADGWGHTPRRDCGYGTGKEGRDWAEEGQCISSSVTFGWEPPRSDNQIWDGAEDSAVCIRRIGKVLKVICVGRKNNMSQIDWDEDDSVPLTSSSLGLRKKAMNQLMTERRILDAACLAWPS